MEMLNEEDFSVEVLVKFFVLERVYTSVSEAEEIEISLYEKICKRLNAAIPQLKGQFNWKEFRMPECEKGIKNINKISNDTAEIGFIIRVNSNEQADFKRITDGIFHLVEMLKNWAGEAINNFKGAEGIKIANNFFLSNPLILVAVGAKEKTKHLQEKTINSMVEDLKLRKLLVYELGEKNGESVTNSEAVIYGQILETEPDDPVRSFNKYISLYCAEYSLDTEVAASYLFEIVLRNIHLSLIKTDFSFSQVKKMKSKKYLISRKESVKFKNIVDASIETFKDYIQELERNEYEIFNFAEAKQREIDLLFIKASEYYSKLLDYYYTIKRHYDSLKKELNLSNKKPFKDKDIEVDLTVKEEENWINFIDADLILENKVKNLHTEVSYAKSNFDLLEDHYNYLRHLIYSKWKEPPDLIIAQSEQEEAGVKNQNIYLKVRTLNDSVFSFIARSPKNADDKEKIIDALLNSFKDNKTYAEQIIEKFSQIFTAFVYGAEAQKAVIFDTENPLATIKNIFKYGGELNKKDDSGSDIKITDEVKFKVNIPLLLKSLKRVYFSGFEECVEIRNITEEAMPDILFLAAINENSTNLFEIAFEEYQKNKEFDKVEKLLSLLIGSLQANEKKKGQNRGESVLLKTIKEFAFNYHISRYNIYEALNLAVGENHVSLFFRIISLLWKNTAKFTKTAIISLLILFLMLSPIYAFSNLSAQFKIISVWINIFIILSLAALFIAILIEIVYEKIKQIITGFTVVQKEKGDSGTFEKIEKQGDDLLRNSHNKMTYNVPHADTVNTENIKTRIRSAVSSMLRKLKAVSKSRFSKPVCNTPTNIHKTRVLLPRLIGAILVGIFGSIMADIDWTLIANLKNSPVYYYLWILLSILGSLYYFYYKISPWYNKKSTAWNKAINISLVGFIYSYVLSVVLVDLVVPIRFALSSNPNQKLIRLAGFSGVGNSAFFEIVKAISSFYYPYYILFFSSISLLLGTALQLLWTKEQITEEF